MNNDSPPYSKPSFRPLPDIPEVPEITSPNSSTKSGSFKNDSDSQGMDERSRYAKFIESLRPAALSIPATRSAASGASGMPTSIFINTSSENTKFYGSAYDENNRRSTAQIDDPRSSPNLKARVSHFASDSNDSNDSASLVYASNLHVPGSCVIPESRIKTPRTPQIPPRSVNRRRTKSPSDERDLGPASTSPSAYLVNRYKAQTPRAVDFKV